MDQQGRSTASKILASFARDELLAERGMSVQLIRSRTNMLMDRGTEQKRLKSGFGVRLDCQSIGAHLKIVEIIMDGPCHAEMDSQQMKNNCKTNCNFVII
ncbi:hypothetical protein L5515_019698 [Caenorhabditis briggsae]|uniref:Uncharacterized protein n=1 Tax=Caenorhabditis briggsae TaxID=6238 RepID=A0AAE9JTG8_CAEBR|nr:hypothetical protein L5515_019698 [Caenorhabditis briggsae]